MKPAKGEIVDFAPGISKKCVQLKDEFGCYHFRMSDELTIE